MAKKTSSSPGKIEASDGRIFALAATAGKSEIPGDVFLELYKEGLERILKTREPVQINYLVLPRRQRKKKAK
ncbi:MAG: hypothetical protein AAB492_04070 [Patescibacteria group bacterium]